jgi:predicted MPP superfamily phosphohydrolase
MDLEKLEKQVTEFLQTKVYSTLARATPEDIVFVKIDIYRFDPEIVQSWQNQLAKAWPNLRILFIDLNDEVESIPKEKLLAYIKTNQADDLLVHH